RVNLNSIFREKPTRTGRIMRMPRVAWRWTRTREGHMSIEEQGANTLDEVVSEVEEEASVLEAVRASKTDLAPAEALERMRRGEVIRDVRIVDLRFKGEFPLPVRMEWVELVQPKFERAEFQEDVVFDRCKIIKPTSGKGCVFAKGLDLRGSN